MAKKKKFNKEEVSDPVKKVPAQEEQDHSQFGGLPDRDLKRNLGCG